MVSGAFSGAVADSPAVPGLSLTLVGLSRIMLNESFRAPLIRGVVKPRPGLCKAF
ncbi:hypothetical protein SCFA_3680003 [anaerobic digester metagenome]|uniref:Uncharacterized protein n=1 Tax=anaerobic digester metagenome TaxID=1263854 RepID=A0A485M5M2_9ZZZZ